MNDKKTKLEPIKFETCFAKGLDLSEFSSSEKSHSDEPQMSAAAELLKAKTVERIEREKEEEMEEKIMSKAAERRFRDEQKKTEQQTSGHLHILERGDGFNSNVLISMHSSDLSGGKREMVKRVKKVNKRTMHLKYKQSFSVKHKR